MSSFILVAPRNPQLRPTCHAVRPATRFPFRSCRGCPAYSPLAVVRKRIEPRCRESGAPAISIRHAWWHRDRHTFSCKGQAKWGSCLAPAECPKPEPPGKTGFRTNGAIAGALIKLQADGAASTTKLSRSRMACGYELPPPTCPRQGSRARHRPERRAPAALL